MKKILLFILLFFTSFFVVAQDTEAPSEPANLILWPFLHRNITVIWNASTDNVAVTEYEIYLNDTLDQTVAANGSNIQSVSYDNVQNGTYCYKVVAKDAAGNSSGFSNEECRTVNELVIESPPTTEIFLSAMVNFTGDERLIEVKNYTNSVVDLSNYELRMSIDGSGTWDTTYTFPVNATIDADGYTFIVAHTNSSICSDIINDYNNIITNFDGNDVIGLFKNNVLIDIIGTLGSSQTIVNEGSFLSRFYAINQIPTATYENEQWRSSLESNIPSCPGLGYLDLGLLSTKDVSQNSLRVFPNPTNGDVVYLNTENNTEVSTATIFDISGKQVLSQSNISNQINVENLQQGMYMLQLQIGDQIVTKKLIKQ